MASLRERGLATDDKEVEMVSSGSGSGTVFTKLHFLCNLQVSAISESVCQWQAFQA